MSSKIPSFKKQYNTQFSDLFLGFLNLLDTELAFASHYKYLWMLMLKSRGIIHFSQQLLTEAVLSSKAEMGQSLRLCLRTRTPEKQISLLLHCLALDI